jgi:hypothetical protein
LALVTAVEAPDQAAGGAPPVAGERRRRLVAHPVAVAVELLGGLVYLALRWWRTAGVYPMVFQDSLKLLESAETYGWLSRELWAGWRSPMTPLLFKVVGATQIDVDPAIALHVVLGSVAWLLLAVTVGRRLPGRWRWFGFVVVLLTGLTTPVTMWDHVILTESLSITLFLFPVVAGIRLAERCTWSRSLAFLLAMAPLALIRDIHLVFTGPLALGAVAVAVVAIRRRRAGVAAMAVVSAVTLVGLALFMRWSTIEGERDIQATRETLFVKILPYEERFEWFADHGMPDAERLRGLRAGIARDPQTGTPLFPLPQYEDPAWPQLSAWVRDNGQFTYYRWLLTHPFEALNDWFVRPKMIWNSAGDSWAFYRNPDFPTAGASLLDRVLYPPLVILAGVSAVAVGFLVERKRRWWATGLGATALVVLSTGLVHGVLSWLGDPAEVSRHAMLANLQVRLGCLLLILLAVPVAVAALRGLPGDAPAPPAAGGTGLGLRVPDGEADVAPRPVRVYRVTSAAPGGDVDADPPARAGERRPT